MSNTSSAPPSARDLVAQAGRAGTSMTVRLAEQIVACGEPAVEPLIALIAREGAWEDQSSEAAMWAPIHAFHLLGAIGHPDAAPALLDSLLEQDLGDVVTETAPGVIGNLDPRVLALLIETLAQRPIQDPYVRSALVSGMIQLAARCPELRPEVTAAVRRELHQATDDFISILVDDAVLIDDPEVQRLIDEAFAQDRVELFLVSHETIERARARNTPWKFVPPLHEPMSHFEHIEHMARKPRRSPASGSRPAGQASRPLKVGRNDPCPCGNGKKYKKCHGA